MAKKEETTKIVLERTYNVPLRKEFQKVANWRKTEKAVTALKQFISKHMKSDDVIISRYANLELWKNGIKNPPHHVKISAKKDEKGKIVVELAELPAKAKRELEKQKTVDKKKEKKEAEKKKAEEATKKPEDKKEEKVPEIKQEQAKVAEKEELKELKKEMPKQQAPQPMAAPKQVEQRPTAPKGQ
jgi:large subunit ribosomal protein L31e|tara:strand:+ start:40 stop:597 length:558 start_codon:yes stop_codon:yes gene_type:complete